MVIRWVNRVPVTTWLAITIVLVYATWNPSGVSLFHFITWDWPWLSVRVVVVVSLLVIYALYLNETFNSFHKFGAIIFVVCVGSLAWLASDLGINLRSVALWQWVIGLVVAVFLWLGMQGGRMMRMLSGRVPVAAADTDGHHHHQS